MSKKARTEAFTLRECSFIPNDLEHGIIYFSKDYSTAMHLCACGCGNKVITPIKPSYWRIAIENGLSVSPSIGNWDFPCRSHYWITNGKVRWDDDFSPERVDELRRDEREIRIRSAATSNNSVLARIRSWANGLVRRLRG